MPSLPDWLTDFLLRRYGRSLPDAEAAWRILCGTAYAQVGTGHHTRSVIPRPPEADLQPGELVPRAVLLWQTLILIERAARSSRDLLAGPLGTELVAIAADAAGHVADALHERLVTALMHRHRADFDATAQRFLGVFDDLDALLATRPELRFDTFLRSATSWAAGPEDATVLSDNARRPPMERPGCALLPAALGDRDR